jgi:hypothetical protein
MVRSDVDHADSVPREGEDRLGTPALDMTSRHRLIDWLGGAPAIMDDTLSYSGLMGGCNSAGSKGGSEESFSPTVVPEHTSSLR